MARMSFTSNNRKEQMENFPKFSLGNQESARVVVVHEPESAYVHNLRAPKLVNGEVQYSGDEMIFDFLGNPICLGSESILEERGFDAKNCPACAAFRENADYFSKPQMKYATHVYQYQTNGTSKAPLNAEGTVKVWAFGPQKFNELIDIYEEAETTDPKTVDIVLGPCENVKFQKYSIKPGQKTAWSANDSTKSRFEEAVETNQSKDLYRYIGRNMGKDFMEDKIDEVIRKWKQAKGQANETSADGIPERNADAGLAGVNKDDPWSDSMPKVNETSHNKSTSTEAVDLESLLKDL